MDVRISTNGFRILNNRFGTALVDAELQAGGDFAAPKIAGRLRVSDGRIEVDRVLETTTKSVYSTQPQVPDEPLAADEVVRADGAVVKSAAPDTSRDTLFGRLDLALEVVDVRVVHLGGNAQRLATRSRDRDRAVHSFLG